MHKQAVLCWLVLVVCEAMVCAEDKYTTKYDNVDFDEIIASERLLKNYVNCLLDRGSCTPDAKELKRVLPEALETGCIKCSDTQKRGIGKVIKHLIKDKTTWWDELEAKYDPQGKYWERNRDKLQQEGITRH